MKKRIQIAKTAPAAYKAMLDIEKYLEKSGLDKTLYELIKTRASQINGCAYCLNMNTRDALKWGESPQRLFLLDAWRETDLYSDKEKAALALTESITCIKEGNVPDDVYEQAAAHFSEKELAAVIMAVVAINAWNRISIATRTPLD